MKYRSLIFIVLITLLLSGCVSLAGDITPPPGYVPPTPRPTLPPSFPKIPPVIEQGAIIYAEKCAPCHGPTGLGDGSQGAQLPNPPSPLGETVYSRQAVPEKWFAAVTQGNLESFMPPFTSLSEQERWDVVAYSLSLGTSAEEIALGKEIYTANCAACHGDNGRKVTQTDFTDQSYMAKLSATELFIGITEGANEMPAFSQLPESERWALTAYLRSMTFGTPVARVLPTATLVPTETPEPAVTAEGTPGAETTSEPSVTETAEPSVQVGAVTGKVENGSGGEVPSGLTVTLVGYDHSATAGGGPVEVLSESAPVGADSTYNFDDIELVEGRLFLVKVTFQEMDFISELGIFEPGSTSLELPVMIYDMTTDLSSLKADQVHILFDFSNPDSVTVIEFHVISNQGDKVVAASEPGQGVASFLLPEGYSNLLFEDGRLGERFIQTSGGFADTVNIPPGQGRYQVVFAYDLPYKRKLDLVHPISMDISSLSVLVPDGIKLTSEQLTRGETRSFQGINFGMYTAVDVKSSQTLTLTISGKLKASTADNTGAASSNNGLLIGIGALGIVLIATGGWLFWRDRQREDGGDDLEDENGFEYESEEELMDAIIALDDQFRSGNIAEEAYKERRTELKNQLKKTTNLE